MDSSTQQLLSAISSWRSSHTHDPSFAQINAKLTSLEDDLKGDADGDLKSSGKPSFPKKGQVPAALAAFQAKKNSAKGGATAQ